MAARGCMRDCFSRDATGPCCRGAEKWTFARMAARRDQERPMRCAGWGPACSRTQCSSQEAATGPIGACYRRYTAGAKRRQLVCGSPTCHGQEHLDFEPHHTTPACQAPPGTARHPLGQRHCPWHPPPHTCERPPPTHTHDHSTNHATRVLPCRCVGAGPAALLHAPLRSASQPQPTQQFMPCNGRRCCPPPAPRPVMGQAAPYVEATHR